MDPRPGEIGLGSFADYAWIERTGPQVRVGPQVGFGHSGDYGQYVTVQPARGAAAARFPTVLDRDDERCSWGDFSGFVAELYGRGRPGRVPVG